MLFLRIYITVVLLALGHRHAATIAIEPSANVSLDYRRYVYNVPPDSTEPATGRWPDPAANAALSQKYEPIREWFGFSERFNISQQCQEGRKLRWAYFSRSAEATWDFISISHAIQAPYTLIQPRLFYDLSRNTTGATDPYMSTKNIAFLKWRALGHMICHMADILVFGDATADARPMLQGNCTTPIILHIHSKFTVGVVDMVAYVRLLAEAATRTWVWFIASNPYELHLLKSTGIPLPPSRTLLLRPVGACLLPQPPPVTPQQASRLAMLANHKQGADGSLVDAWLARTQLVKRIDLLTDPVVHPASLAQRRGVLHVPIHPAAMLMYSGMAAGAVFVLPSPAFFAQLVAERGVPFCCRSIITQQPESWQEIMDWWHPSFRDGHVFFDSWEELSDIVKGRGKYTRDFFAAKATKSKSLMMSSRARSLAGFASVYKDAMSQSCQTVKYWPPGYLVQLGRNYSGNEPKRF